MSLDPPTPTRGAKTRAAVLAPADYVAIHRLSDANNETLAEPGQTCEHVPATSLNWLLEQGHIERAKKSRIDSGAP